jgi:hypothetical protein
VVRTGWICSPPGKPPYPAIAILAMKERNDQDNLKAYEDQLKHSRHAVRQQELFGAICRQIQGNDQNVARLSTIAPSQFRKRQT